MSERNDAYRGCSAFPAGVSAPAGVAPLGPVTARAASGRCAQRLRFFAEGDARTNWVLSLLPVPAPPPPIVVRVRYRFPAIEAGQCDRDVMSVRVVMLTEAREVPISVFHVAVENVVVASASFRGDDNPENNLLLSGRVIAVDTEAIQPFGDLNGRAFGLGCGFQWDDTQRSAAVFKLLAGAAAGSHVSVLPEAEGFVEIDGPLDSF